MSRPRKATDPELARRLAGVKIMVHDLKDAMPTMARELRRNACETLDEIIEELTRA